MRSEAASVLGLAFQSAKSCKTKYNRCAFVFRSRFSERNSYISIYHQAYTRSFSVQKCDFLPHTL